MRQLLSLALVRAALAVLIAGATAFLLAPAVAGAAVLPYDSAGYLYDVGVSDAQLGVVNGDGIGRVSGVTPSSKAVGNVYDASGSFVAPSGIPRGFGNAADFGAFGDDLYAGLRGAGYDDVTVIFQGSSVTGQSFRTGAGFDVGRVSDFDIALASPQLLNRASALGIGLRSGGTRTGPLTASQLQRLGLGDLATDLGTSAGRPVNFMIFDSAAGATARSPSIVVPG